MADLGDSIDDLHLLFDEVDTSSIVTSVHSDPHVHSLHDQSSYVEVIFNTYEHKLQRVSLSVEETDSSLREVLHSSFIGIIEQVLETTLIHGILSTHSRSISFVPLALFLPNGRNTILQSWISFFIKALTSIHSSLGGRAYLFSLPLLIILLCIYWMYFVMGGS